MRCPLDKHDMIVVEYHRIELDHCLHCHGVWFDASELDLLVESLGVQGSAVSRQALLQPQPAQVTEAGRKCPTCNHKMDKVWLGENPRVLIDSCPKGHGLWFDGNELHQVLGQISDMSEGSTQDVMHFILETFKAEGKH